MNKEILEYKIIRSNTEENLSAEIFKEIINGWQPYGSIGVAAREGGIRLYQPLVIYKK